MPLSYSPSALTDLCRRWKVRKTAIFGSAVRDDFGPSSDVDLAVSFNPASRWSLQDVVDMQEELEAFFSRSVDIVELEAVRYPISRKIITGSMRLVYEE